MAKKSRGVVPVQRSRALDDHAGQWVALLDGQVIAYGESASDVVRRLRKLGSDADGAVLMRAASDQEALAVGLG